jgi:glutaredoxin
MMPHLTLYTRQGCCLCDEMKAVIEKVRQRVPLLLTEVDVDSASELQARFGTEVPVLFIDGRKAFKFKFSAAALRRKLLRSRLAAKTRRLFSGRQN